MKALFILFTSMFLSAFSANAACDLAELKEIKKQMVQVISEPQNIVDGTMTASALANYLQLTQKYKTCNAEYQNSLVCKKLNEDMKKFIESEEFITLDTDTVDTEINRFTDQLAEKNCL